jgi:hypothetical protein
MTVNRIKAAALERQRQADALRPELANRADQVWLIMKPSLKNFTPSEIETDWRFIIAELSEYRATAQLETLKTE